MQRELDHVGRILAQYESRGPDADVATIGMIGRVHRISDRIADERRATYAEHGVGSGEFEVLAALLRMGPPHELSPTDIAGWTLVSTGAVTKRVDRCVEQGWVTRRSAQQDGRGRVIALTDKGREVAAAVYESHIRTLHALVEPLEEDERTGMADLLEKWGRALGA